MRTMSFGNISTKVLAGSLRLGVVQCCSYNHLMVTCAGQGRAMNDFTAPITASKSDSVGKQTALPKEPKEPHSSSQAHRQKSSAFKQTTLSFGKKPSADRHAEPARAAVPDVVDLSNI